MPDPARILQQAYDNVRHEYGTAIGQRVLQFLHEQALPPHLR